MEVRGDNLSRRTGHSILRSKDEHTCSFEEWRTVPNGWKRVVGMNHVGQEGGRTSPAEFGTLSYGTGIQQLDCQLGSWEQREHFCRTGCSSEGVEGEAQAERHQGVWEPGSHSCPSRRPVTPLSWVVSGLPLID